MGFSSVLGVQMLGLIVSRHVLRGLLYDLEIDFGRAFQTSW